MTMSMTFAQACITYDFAMEEALVSFLCEELYLYVL